MRNESHYRGKQSRLHQQRTRLEPLLSRQYSHNSVRTNRSLHHRELSVGRGLGVVAVEGAVVADPAIEHVARVIAGQPVVEGGADKVFDGGVAVARRLVGVEPAVGQIGRNAERGTGISRRIAAAAAVHRIAANAAVQQVRARTAKQRIGPAAPFVHIITRAAIEHVGAGAAPAIEPGIYASFRTAIAGNIGAKPADQPVRARTAIERIGLSAAGEPVAEALAHTAFDAGKRIALHIAAYTD